VKNERSPLSYLLRILRFICTAAIVLTVMHLRRPFQLIYVFSVPEFLVFAALFPKAAGVPVLLDIFDIVPEFYAAKFGVSNRSLRMRCLIWVERQSIRFSDHVTVANHLWKRRLESRSGCSGKFTAICYYSDPTLFGESSTSRSDRRFVLIYPGSLNWFQGLDIAIKAFCNVTKSIPEAEFHIYGEGAELPSLQALTCALGLEQKVIFHDFVSANQIAKVIAEADLAVVPKRASSTFASEAVSTKILDCFMVGIPVIASRTRIEEFYFNDSMLKFFESENVEDLSRCILEVRDDFALRQRMVMKGLEYVRENNWQSAKHEFLAIVHKLRAHHGRPSETQS
jgi:glycosyltransferase involved in cell wall biosynthesis